MTAVGYEIRTTPAAKAGRSVSVARRGADEALLRPRRAIAITSDQGEAGKSNVSLKLSILLATKASPDGEVLRKRVTGGWINRLSGWCG